MLFQPSTSAVQRGGASSHRKEAAIAVLPPPLLLLLCRCSYKLVASVPPVVVGTHKLSKTRVD